MPTDKPLFYYWDSCVFLALINNEPERAKIIETLWDKVAKSNGGLIYTSAVSVPEVAYGQHEKMRGVLDVRVDEALEELWKSPTVKVVEVPFFVMEKARGLIRDALTNRWVIKPMDSIHLATAMWINHYVVNLEEFHTYDASLVKYATMIGPHIREPHVSQPNLL